MTTEELALDGYNAFVAAGQAGDNAWLAAARAIEQAVQKDERERSTRLVRDWLKSACCCNAGLNVHQIAAILNSKPEGEE